MLVLSLESARLLQPRHVPKKVPIRKGPPVARGHRFASLVTAFFVISRLRVLILLGLDPPAISFRCLTIPTWCE
jgi:hypothetical protein